MRVEVAGQCVLISAYGKAQVSDRPSVSVIAPVHNAGEFLPPLLDALAAQTLTDIELVFIDDGSDDGSGARLDDFATRHRNTVVVHQNCAGPSVARNRGMEVAKGDYLGFADADDLPMPSHYATVLALARRQNLDVVICNGSEFVGRPADGDRQFFKRPKPAGVLSGEQWLTACHADGEYLHNVFLHFVRREFLQHHRLFFEPGIVHEDVIWTTRLLLATSRLSYVDACLYRYRMAPGSITRSDSPSSLQRRIHGYSAVVSCLLDEASARRGAIAKALREHALKEAINMLGLVSRLPLGRERWTASRWLVNRGLLRRLRREGRGWKLYRRLLRTYWWAARRP